MTDQQRRILADLRDDARRDGLEHHLDTAQSLARDGVDATIIDGMMRSMYSRAQIQAMIADAKQTAAH